MSRSWDRKDDQIRPASITPTALAHAEGSAFIEMGSTKALVAASVEEGVPPFLIDSGKSCVTAEYSLLPRSTHTRSRRARGGKLGGRNMGIQRLIGRSLRCVADLKAIGQYTITVDCDVIQADGGARCASITASWVALKEALDFMAKRRIDR